MTPALGRDPHAVRHSFRTGTPRLGRPRTVAVVGGGIAGIAAAAGLCERGARVILFESTDRLGGRVAAWPLPDGRSMSRGFHAFFRQYYNLRRLLHRADPALTALVPVADYPLQRRDGMRDSFSRIPTSPPWNVLGFVARSPAFSLGSLAQVDVRAALELVRVRFPETFSAYDGESAAAFLDRLRFPQAARDLALEVFARSFFADPTEFAAGELIAMFHTYFLGSGEGLVFDVPTDDYDTALWAPMGRLLGGNGVEIRTGTRVERIVPHGDGVEIHTDGDEFRVDAAVLATDPRAARALVAGMPEPVDPEWARAVATTRNAPPFVVTRLWLDGLVNSDRPAFLGMSGYGSADNVAVLERFERSAARWSTRHGGSVVELHAYACSREVQPGSAAAEGIDAELERRLHQVYPETARLRAVHRELLVRDDCALVTPDPWERRPGVRTPWPNLMVAGDWVRCDYPVALMERAATTGFLAANALLTRWGSSGQDLWTAPMAGILRSRRAAARASRRRALDVGTRGLG
ncbi:FAD-dependent oxidoreductase [Pseudactinotalea sp. HY158]|uniref:FAD-dependent oxidoreductase n=1 Tax=Pseudactinotalea sp. HY158 TaxID=2654547 RepID=UPI00129C1140|nr:FAD-dependent oxidoreductase [Pseudactinotalea sp. HY158]QGH70199.1 NAD(P)-binding protein [Pseudactinotalea sp. HY158]